MVFSSVPLYLDPPNWHHEQLISSTHQQHGSTNTGIDDSQLSQPQPQLPPQPGQGRGGSSIRPGSMADKARVAKIPTPEAGLKCPRCESTNTKFCYFNNYSLSQPRHFCKTCRRYWTRGGALRSVPVGGGCRRNKRRSSKGGNNNNSNDNSNTSTKSPIKGSSSSTNYNSTSGLLGSNSCTSDLVMGHINIPPQITQQFPILPPLNNLVDYNSTDIGLNFGGIQPPVAVSAGDGAEFQIGTSHGGGVVVGGSMLSSSGFIEQLRSIQQGQQFIPLFANLDQPISSGLYGFESSDDHEGVLNTDYAGQYRSKMPLMDTGISQRAAAIVKSENQNSSTNILNMGNNDRQFWDGNDNGNGNGNAWSSHDIRPFGDI